MSAAALRPDYDVAVIGAGPAGLAAASACARAGLATLLLDEQAAPGGQIYRAITETPLRRRAVLGADYWRGTALVDDFLTGGAQYLPGAAVWSVSPAREIGISVGGAARLVTARRIILATGAQERPFPIPGWTLPGVMTAGAAQILLKSAGLVPGGPVVLAGCGPLLWLLARQLDRAGLRLDAILDTTPVGNWRHALPHLPRFLASRYGAQGLALMLAVRRRVRVISRVTALRAEGEARVTAVSYRTAGGATGLLPVESLLMHHGVVPQVNLAMSIGIAHRWNDVQACWEPELERDGNSAIAGIAIAGDGAGIAGAHAAALRGRLAASSAIAALTGGTAPDAAEIAGLRRALAREIARRRFIDHLYRPGDGFRRPQGDVVVCRCESVTARQIHDAVARGCTGPNQLKAFLRAGMGPCQGRLCGLTVTELIAAQRSISPDEVGHYRLRAPVKPITLGELASLPQDEDALRAVVRG